MKEVSFGWDKTNELFVLSSTLCTSMLNSSIMYYLSDYCVLYRCIVVSQRTFSCCVSVSCIIHDVIMLICRLAGGYCCSESQTAASLIRLTQWSGRKRKRRGRELGKARLKAERLSTERIEEINISLLFEHAVFAFYASSTAKTWKNVSEIQHSKILNTHTSRIRSDGVI